MDDLLFERSLPPHHQALGWATLLCWPLLTILAFGGFLAAFDAHGDRWRKLALELPTGEIGLFGALAALALLSLAGPALAVLGYQRWVVNHYGRCWIGDSFAEFHLPLIVGLANRHQRVPLAQLTQRRATRHGLRVKGSLSGGWLLIPTSSHAEAHALIRTLDDRAAAEFGAEPRGVAELPAATALRMESRTPDELIVSWPIVRPRRRLLGWILAIALTPVFGIGLIVLPSLLAPSRRHRLRLTAETLELRRGTPLGWLTRSITEWRKPILARGEVDGFPYSDMLYLVASGYVRNLATRFSATDADMGWLYEHLRAWRAGKLRFTPEPAEQQAVRVPELAEVRVSG